MIKSPDHPLDDPRQADVAMDGRRGRGKEEETTRTSNDIDISPIEMSPTAKLRRSIPNDIKCQSPYPYFARHFTKCSALHDGTQWRSQAQEFGKTGIVLEEKDGWCLMSFDEGGVAWVECDYIVAPTIEQPRIEDGPRLLSPPKSVGRSCQSPRTKRFISLWLAAIKIQCMFRIRRSVRKVEHIRNVKKKTEIQARFSGNDKNVEAEESEDGLKYDARLSSTTFETPIFDAVLEKLRCLEQSLLHESHVLFEEGREAAFENGRLIQKELSKIKKEKQCSLK